MRVDLPKIFEGKQVTVVGGGSSLIDFDFDRIQGDAIAVNESLASTPRIMSFFAAYLRINRAILASGH